MKKSIRKVLFARNPMPAPQELRRLIETRAYHIWRSSGGSPGGDLENWLRAEQEILSRVRRSLALD
ncbi:MAG TPA: DUF2934 domain-containing protein [Verrucomicrobiae bacterium]|nr:DUF2934 domain-containing protein [Verrucomicrobiae bacterium]